MIVTNCPRCGEAFRIPAEELPDDAYAQCPWCRDTFPVTEVLRLLPPVLEVLSADGSPIVPVRHQAAALGVAWLSDASASPGFGTVAEGADAEFFIDEPAESSEFDAEDLPFQSPSTAETVVEDEMSKIVDVGELSPDELSFEDFAESDQGQPGNKTVTEETVAGETWSEHQAELTSDDDLVDFEVEDRDHSWESDASAPRDEIAPMRVSPGPARRNKRPGSLVGTVIKVVLGGVLAVPIAGGLLTLWWGRAPDWGFWPFNGGGPSNRSVIAAPPAELSMSSSRPTATQDIPSGRMLKPDLGNDDFNIASDPADAAHEQLQAEPSVDNFSPREQTGSPIVLPAANDFALNESSAFDSSAPENAAVSSGPELAASSLEMPAVENSEESLDQKLQIESTKSRTTIEEETPPANQLRDLNQPSVQPEAESLLPETNIAEALPESDTKPSSDAEQSVTSQDSPQFVKDAKRAGLMVGFFSQSDESDPDERIIKIAKTYRQIAIACDSATRDSNALKTLATEIVSSPILDELGDMAPEWLRASPASRKGNGILLVGQADASSGGKTITLDSGMVLSIASDMQLPAAGRVLAMGRIIDENSVELVLAQPLP